jgi:RHS repeat-associated protein
MVITPDGNNQPVVLQANDYYPFGMAYNMNFQSGGGAIQPNKYLYNSKEEQEMPGKWLDYGSRFYDSQLARFHTVDPLAEKYYFESPYIYVGNNPLLFLDPDGREKLKFFGKISLTQGKVGFKARVADIGIGGSVFPFGGSELSFETSTILYKNGNNVIFGISGEYASVSEGSSSGTVAIYSGSDTEKDITKLSWDSSEGGQVTKQKESESTGSVFMFGKKTTEIEKKDSNGDTTEKTTEKVYTMKADVSYELNLLIIGIEVNFGAYAEEKTK